MLHMISFNYPVNPTSDDKENYYSYILSLQNVLPCKSCRDNLTKNLKELNFSKNKLENREVFSKFIYDLHNHVNLMLGKQKYMTYEEVRDKFELFRAKCINGTPLIPLHKTGCIKPLNNIQSQTIIYITPLKDGQESFIIDEKCIPVNKGGLIKPSKFPIRSSKKSPRSPKRSTRKLNKSLRRSNKKISWKLKNKKR
ncbi:MAG: FAD-linked sulfhydryl oxidase [Cetobacterium sp.]